MKLVQIWTDGTCKPLKNISAVGCVLLRDGRIKKHSRTLELCSNQEAELQAVIYALQDSWLHVPSYVQIFCDNEQVCDILSGNRAVSWSKPLWDDCLSLIKPHSIYAKWTRRNTHEYQTLAHNLANDAVRKALK